MGVIQPSSPFLLFQRLVQSTTQVLCGLSTFCSRDFQILLRQRLVAFNLCRRDGAFSSLHGIHYFLKHSEQLFANCRAKNRNIASLQHSPVQEVQGNLPFGNIFTEHAHFRTQIVNFSGMRQKANQFFSPLKEARHEIGWNLELWRKSAQVHQQTQSKGISGAAWL